MESYIIPTHLHTGQFFHSSEGGGFWKKWPPWLGPSSCFDPQLQGHMASGMIQKLMRVSLKSNSISCLTTKLLRSRQPIHSLIFFFFNSWTFRKWNWGWLKQIGKSKSGISQECQRDVTWRLSFHVYKLSRQLHMEAGFSVIYLLDSGWSRGTVGKQLSSSIIREGKGKHKHTQVDIQNKVEIWPWIAHYTALALVCQSARRKLWAKKRNTVSHLSVQLTKKALCWVETWRSARGGPSLCLNDGLISLSFYLLLASSLVRRGSWARSSLSTLCRWKALTFHLYFFFVSFIHWCIDLCIHLINCKPN